MIEHFLYPKLGPGQMWQEVARRVLAGGGELHLRHQVVGLVSEQRRIARVRVRDLATGREREVPGDYVLSTMPVKNLVAALEGDPVPANVREVASGLQYRDFITVGLLLRKLKIRNQTGVPTPGDIVPDNWIYVQERDVKVGRLQIFNNWSPYLVRDPQTTWIGMEFFCSEGDELWSMPDDGLKALGEREMQQLRLADPGDLVDAVHHHALPGRDTRQDRHALAVDRAQLDRARRHRIVVPHYVGEHALTPALDRRGRNDGLASGGIELHAHVDELVWKERAIVVREGRLELDRAGGGIDQVVDRGQRAAREPRLLLPVPGLHRQAGRPGRSRHEVLGPPHPGPARPVHAERHPDQDAAHGRQSPSGAPSSDLFRRIRSLASCPLRLA